MQEFCNSHLFLFIFIFKVMSSFIKVVKLLIHFILHKHMYGEACAKSKILWCLICAHLSVPTIVFFTVYAVIVYVYQPTFHFIYKTRKIKKPLWHLWEMKIIREQIFSFQKKYNFLIFTYNFNATWNSYLHYRGSVSCHSTSWNMH